MRKEGMEQMFHLFWEMARIGTNIVDLKMYL